MATQQLTQPIINPIAAFDATQPYEVTFLAIGGAQVIGNRIVISDNQTGDIIYDNRITTMKLSHTVPTNTLTNGGYYNVVIYTIDSANNFSQASVPVPFYCYSQPTLTIVNIPAGSTIENGTYSFQGSYAQQQNESLNSYQFILYDSNKTELSQSDVIYYASNNSLSYTFAGMSNDTSYYIELKGQTVNNTEITTGLLYFTVRYSQPASFAIVDLINDCENGFIQISSNIVAIDGKSNPEPPIYIDNKEVDLRDPDSWVRWDEGFNIKDDFTMRVWGRDFNDFEPIITLSNQNNTDSEPNKIEMKWMIADVMKTLPDYTLVSGKNISIINGYKTDISDLSIYGNSEQIKKDSIDFGTANSMTIDTTKDMYLDVDVYGNQYQATREGYNFLKVEKETTTADGITFTVNQDGSITCKGTATATVTLYFKSANNSIYPKQLEAGTYKLSGGTTNIMLGCQIGSVYYNTNSARTIELTEQSSISNAYIQIASGKTVNNETIYPLLYEYNDTDKPYEQYGASPSPDYPSEIETVGSNINLLDGSRASVKTANGMTFSYSENEGLRLDGTTTALTNFWLLNLGEKLEVGNYTLSSNVSLENKGNYILKDANGNLVQGNLKQAVTFECSETTTTDFLIQINSGVTFDNQIFKIKLEKGSVATPYSPYNQGSVGINIVNSNLVNFANAVQNPHVTVNADGTITINGKGGFSLKFESFLVKANTKYYMKWELVSGSIEGIGMNNIFINPLTSEWLGKDTFIESSVSEDKQISSSWVHANAVFTNAKIKMWISKSQSDFVPHQSQTAIMPIQQEMLDGDYVADVEHHEWGKIILTGNESWNKSSTTEIDRFSYNTSDYPAFAEGFSNCFLVKKGISSEIGILIFNAGTQIVINFSNYGTTTLEEFKAWLKSKYDEGSPVIIYYKLATPTDLDLTNEQQSVLNTLINAYDQTTNVYTSDDLSLLKVSTTPVPSPKLSSKIYSSGDKKNQLEDLGVINIDYNQGYFETTDTNFLLKPDYIYNLSFDYIVNNTTTDLYFTVSYKSNGEIFDITDASQYANRTAGRNNISFMVPENIPSGSTLSIKFARTIIQANVSVSVNNVALVKGRFSADYQSPDIYNIYPTITQKNIFNYNDIYYIRNENATLTYIQNGFSSEVVTTGEKSFFEFGFPNILQPGNKYAISYNSYGAIKSAKIYTMDKETGETLEQITTENGVFTAPSNLYDIKAEFVLDDSVADNQVQVWNIQLESGEQVTEAETYTSNSTDLILEQPLRGIENYRDLACLESPNILNPETQIAIVKGSTTYSLSQSGKTAYNFDYINEDNNIISSESMANGQFTTPDNCVRIKFDTTSDVITTNKLQVNLGDTAMVYYPYVNEPSIIRYVKELALTGNETWSYDNINKVFYTNLIRDTVFRNNSTINVISNQLLGIFDNQWRIVAKERDSLIWSNVNGVLYIIAKEYVTLEEFKTMLKSKYEAGAPIIINYVLSMPTIEPLSSDNILALQNLKTYDRISNVFTNNSIPANLNFSYISGQSKQETQNAYITLKCWNGNVMPYFTHSNYIDIPKETDKVFIWLRRKNNIFDLKIENLEDYGEDKPGNKGNPQVAITVDDTTTTTITITANTIDTATLNNVKFSKDNGATWDAEIPLDGLSSTDTYTFTGLQPATTYQIRVEATNVNGITGGITQQVITRAS